MQTKNLGLVKAIFVGPAAPSNKDIIWRDTVNGVHKAWNTTSLVWEAIGSGGSGTVTSVSVGNLSPLFTSSVVNSTTTPSVSYSLPTQSANRVYAGPTSGGVAMPTFRALVAADLPTNYLTNGNGTTANGTAVGLGGTLSSNVAIDGNGHSFSISNATAFSVVSPLIIGAIGVDDSGVSLSGPVLSSDLAGYTSDLSGSYTARSWVDKAYVQSLTGATGAWKLASGGTLTGVNTITSNARNQLNFNGTWTETTTGDYHATFGGTLTGKVAGAGTEVLNGYVFSPTLTTGTNGQTLNAVLINPTFSGTGTFYALRVQSAGTELFSINNSLAAAGHTVTIASNLFLGVGSGGNMTMTTQSGYGLYLDAGTRITIGKDSNYSLTKTTFANSTSENYITGWVTSADALVATMDNTGSFTMQQNGVDATVSAANQKSSFAQHFKTSLWNGSAETKGWFSWRADASTSVNLAQTLSLYQSTGVSPSFGGPLLSVDSNGNVGVNGTVTNAASWNKVISVKSSSSYAGVEIVGSAASLNTTVGGFEFVNISGGTNRLGQISVFNAGSVSSGYMSFYVNAGSGLFEAMRIDSSGNVLIGGTTITNASCLLDLQSTTKAFKVSRVTNIASVATPTNGMITYDAATNLFNFYQNGAWVTGIGGGGSGYARSINNISGTTAAGSTAFTDYVYYCTGTFTITLPTAVSNTNRYTIKNVGSGTITVATTSSQTIDGSLTATLAANASIDIISDNTNWNVI